MMQVNMSKWRHDDVRKYSTEEFPMTDGIPLVYIQHHLPVAINHANHDNNGHAREGRHGQHQPTIFKLPADHVT